MKRKGRDAAPCSAKAIRAGRIIEPASKKYKRHTRGSRYPVTCKVRHYWFGLDSESGQNDQFIVFSDRINRAIKLLFAGCFLAEIGCLAQAEY
ncbi:hypothetical protein SAMN05216417_106130 [Nitrosospira multiformis]|uniref:Uncharacterized protein n=1 Tax=Nitrosospira multiformis TaxID=1231 RepID=A0A1I7GZK1_9PROT|nr:hypothetical protein SAMN05216417_106130 [Nitrosospira multiformis]